MKNKAIGGALALLFFGMAGGASGAATAFAPPAPKVQSAQSDEDVVTQIENALVQATYACLVETGAVAEGTDPAAVVGGVTDDGTAVAPTAVDAATSDCGAQAAAMVHEIVIANPSDAAEGAAEAEALADAALEGDVTFEDPETTPRKHKWSILAKSALLAGPTADQWIDGMNNRQDRLMDFFITGYGDPGYYNWSSDECSAPLVGNSPWGFAWPCRRHDFGYRNLKGGESRFPNFNMWNRHNKAVTDRQFRDDLNNHCAGSSVPSSCRSDAAAYHYAVSVYDINTWGLEVGTLYKYPR